MDLKTYQVYGIDIQHDGKLYKEGDLIELNDADYAAKRRWLVSAPPQFRPAESKPAKTVKTDEKKQDESQSNETGAGQDDGTDKTESDAGKADGTGKNKGTKQ